MLRSDSSKTYIVQGKSTASPDSYLVEGQAEDVIPHIITKYQNKVKFMKSIPLLFTVMLPWISNLEPMELHNPL